MQKLEGVFFLSAFQFVRVIHLLIASGNRHKVREFARLLGSDFQVSDLSTMRDIPEIREDGSTFEENARIKAVAISHRCAGLVLADDSGIEVESLGGQPGIYSARYAGEHATDAANRQKLLSALAQLAPGASRKARFCCVLVLAQAGEVIGTFEGTVEGEIVHEERGCGGFGYDPIFRPNDSAKTFAEMSAAEKDSISHRGQAVARLREFFRAA